MAEVFDLLDIRLHRAADSRFEGTGTIPFPEGDADNEELLPVGVEGEVSAKGRQPLYSNLTGLKLSFTLEIDL
jgi:hypothetical protein